MDDNDDRIDDEYAALRVDTNGPDTPPDLHPWTARRARWRRPTTRTTLAAGYLLSSVTIWGWLVTAHQHIARQQAAADCQPASQWYQPPAACHPQHPPRIVITAATVTSAAWLIWAAVTFLAGRRQHHPTTGSYFSLRALQERAQIVGEILFGGYLAALMIVTGWAVAWGPGGLVGQATIGVGRWLFLGGPRYPAALAAVKIVAVAAAHLWAVTTIGTNTQGSR